MKKCQSLGALQFAAGQLQLIKNITVVSEDVVPVLSPGIDLEVIVMSIEIWRGYFDPVGYLPERSLAPQLGDILVHQRLYLFHSSIPFCIFGGLVILQ